MLAIPIVNSNTPLQRPTHNTWQTTITTNFHIETTPSHSFPHPNSTYTHTATEAMPSPLYAHLHTLASRHAAGGPDLLTLRHPDAIHRWGHAHARRQHPSLQAELTNDGLKAHFASTGPLLVSCTGKVHNIMVDEHQRRATVWMSYFLTTVAGKGEGDGAREVVENDLIWTLRFSGGDGGGEGGEGEEEENLEDIRIVESTEFIDPTASGRANELLRRAGVEIGEDVVGGLGVVLPSLV